MKVRDLISQLGKLVEANPENADIEVRWYDVEAGHVCRGDGWPVKLFANVYTGEIRCILNALYDPPAFGLKPVSPNRKHAAGRDRTSTGRKPT